ncbi:hypothetical protein CCHR01_11942 [Colletotrichum chrysophilum]|uniref:Uncharacterized protein n=1 Tax=Colletotrichum chrysophilum TaxID=1836956 RepID=A0AAD9EE99_9PEZI|nr:hypothetical protein CCHR01_11942 [Colletotrichum chrysophilum]
MCLTVPPSCKEPATRGSASLPPFANYQIFH